MSTKNTLKQSNKSSKHKEGFKRFIPKTKLGWFFVICAVVVIGFVIYFIASAITSHKIFTRSQVIEYLQEQDRAIQLPGELVYSNIKDNDCRPVGFFQGVYCTYKLEKYYKNSGNKDADVNLAIEALERGGCVKSNNSIGRDGITRYLDVPGEEKYAWCDVTVFSLNGKNSYTDAKDLFGIDKDIPLQDNEYAYGINITREYKYDPNTQ